MTRAIDNVKVESLYPFLAKRIGGKGKGAEIMSIHQDEKNTCLWIDLKGPNLGHSGLAVAKVQMTPNCMELAMLLEFEEVDTPSMML
ncbi:MAG: hypothetical protein RO469_15700 [Thermincola sp.]|jgi:hypothetical protein|nr:hypothetical protein [Thermincola sp.]MDT3702675.1 hypothetical protein [Thermincola sp.]